jgi:molybdopterin converting factor small subunit
VAEPAVQSTDPGEIRVTVRYFAAARAAAGTESETVTVRPGVTVAEVVQGLAKRNARLSTVLSRCSYLCDGIAVGTEAAAVRPLETERTIDVLPPFAGG